MNIKQIIREEIDSDWDFIGDTPDLIPGEEYLIQNNNGTWIKETFVGLSMVPHPTDDGEDYMAYKFKTKNSSGARSEEYFKSMIEKGMVIPYEEGWSMLDHVDQSNTLDDIEGRDFSIYFNKGITVDETLPIQKALKEKGYKFYGKGDEFVTSKDTNKLVKMIECINWDTSDSRYSRMSPTQRDEKLLLFSNFNDSDMWHRGGDDKEYQEKTLQEDIAIIVHHKGILIDGYNLLNNINK